MYGAVNGATMWTMESRSLEVDGIPLRWLDQGEGPPVVFVHGIPTCPRLWRHVIPRIDHGRKMAWEMVGYGSSIPNGKGRDLSLSRQADYLLAWMRALNLPPALLVGHDLGGGVVQIAAVRDPGRVSGLVLMNTVSYDSWPIPMVKAMAAFGGIVEQIPTQLFEYVMKMFILRGHDRRGMAEESFAEHWAAYAEHGGAAAFVRQIRALDVRDTQAIAHALPNLNKPARLVWGADDQFQEIGYGYRLAHDLNATMDRIEGGKHFVPEDHPDRVAAAVNALVHEMPGVMV